MKVKMRVKMKTNNSDLMAGFVEQPWQVLSRFRSTIHRIAITALLTMVAMAGTLALAQQKSNIAGDYVGTLGSLHLKLHLKMGADGVLSGTLDSPDQGASGLPCADFHLDGTALSFGVPSVHGKWKGTIGRDGASLSGIWDQGNPMPLDFTRGTFALAAKPSAVDGIWLGTLQAGSQSLRVQIQVKSNTAGQEFCTLDSLDQHATGLECTNVVAKGNDFAFDVPAVHGHWAGKLSEDSKTLVGTWDQGSPLPLNFTRQSSALTAASVPPPTYDPAIPPVDAAGLQSILDRDLAQSLKIGALAPATDAGITIGVVEHGVQRVFSYGTAKPNSIFEIGSITKTFTGLLLALMVEQDKVKFDEPVRELLPAGTVAKPSGTEITLLDLATQHSGLPRMPDNFKPTNNENPYADYKASDLYAFVAKHGVAKPGAAPFGYSNLGVGLLGQALAVRAGVGYPELLQSEITGPLGMKDTVVSLLPEQQHRFIEGHDAQHHHAHAWDLDALAGAGAIRSTAVDMLIYLEANLHPEKLKANAANGTPDTRTLSAALVQSHELRADVGPGMRIALAWLYNVDTGSYWHNGATGGYSGYALFNPKDDFAVIVLSNTSISNSGSFADSLGQHVAQRLTGKPALSLVN
jgi:serine-type D-Ala-D-Ala carboxypeptidase/endopeptidase